MALACTGGLLIDGLYQDNAFAAIDAFDDTPILDLKPHFPVSDRV
jgi:tRNA (Thr-GGU) A37 N-methylase